VKAGKKKQPIMGLETSLKYKP